MTPETITALKEFGAPILSLGVVAYLFIKVLDQLKENRKDYSSFVLENNHSNTERIEKSTEAMTKISGAIEIHTKVLEKLVEKLDK